MRQQRAGAITMISSLAALENYPFVAYKATKAALIAFTKQVAIQNAEFGIRANVILPGLIDTPMAVDTRARVSGKSRAEVAAERDAAYRYAAKWVRLGTWPMRRCSSPPMRPTSSPAWRFSSTAAAHSTSAEFIATWNRISSGMQKP